MERNREVVASFKDEFGEERQLYKKGARYQVKRNSKTVSLTLSKVVSGIIGSNVSVNRKANGLTLEQLCRAAGLKSTWPKQRMREIETNYRDSGITFGTLSAVAIALGIEAKDLIPSTAELLKEAGVRFRNEKILSLTE